MNTGIHEITELLKRAPQDKPAREVLFRLVEARFREMAQALLRHEHRARTWQPTMLVDDAFLKLVSSETASWENREQFFCSAAKVMRRLLVDDARKRRARKRGGCAVVTNLNERHVPAGASAFQDLVELDDTLNRVQAIDPQAFQVFELHYFMGLELQEIADQVLAVSYATVKRRWSRAKHLLYQELSGNQ